MGGSPGSLERGVLTAFSSSAAPPPAQRTSNSERLSSGLPDEDEQWAWLSSVADEVAGKSIILFLHKPLLFHGGSRAGITIADADRERLISVLSGHGYVSSPTATSTVTARLMSDKF